MGEPSFVEIANRAVAISLDPFRVLSTEIVMNLKLKRRERVARARPGSVSVQRFRTDEHDELDNTSVEAVQIVALNSFETWSHKVKTQTVKF